MIPTTSQCQLDTVSLLDEHMENYNVEASALHRKLQSKTEALKIIQSQLEKFRTERDQFKLMAETLQLRYSSMKHSNEYNFAFGTNSSVAAMMNESRQKNLKLSTEVEALKQKLSELQGDMDLLRSRNAENEKVKCRDEADVKDELDWKSEKADFIMHLEELKRKNAQLTYDMKTVIDEKEEIISERDAYKHKVHRLNHELQVALKANESHSRIIDIDGLILENKYLQEKLGMCESELAFAQQSVSKYKTMLDSKRKKGIIKIGTNNFDNVISHKQVKNLLETNSDLPTKTETISDLRSLCLALMDNLNDKNIALMHQKKTNKILASRLEDLEHRLQIMAGQKSDANFSPSQILLTGYNSAGADMQKKSANVTDDSGTMSSDESNKTSHVYDDNIDSLSSESNASVISSEYSNQGERSEVSSYSALNNDVGASSNYVNKEREEDLASLPPEIADLMHKTLQSLDLQEKEFQDIAGQSQIN